MRIDKPTEGSIYFARIKFGNKIVQGKFNYSGFGTRVLNDCVLKQHGSDMWTRIEHLTLSKSLRETKELTENLCNHVWYDGGKNSTIKYSKCTKCKKTIYYEND